uniref:Uncharacterized protein n=1 Tax=Arundo donax TaxID=35708 RepID=A0A0A9CPL4_ARUDO
MESEAGSWLLFSIRPDRN